MELKIIEKKEQPMLSRIEIKGAISFEGATPSSADVKKQVASEMKVGADLIVIKNIFTKFGHGKADLLAYAYLNKEDIAKIEPKEKKKAEKPGAKPAEGAAEAPKAKAPAVEAKPAEAPKAAEKPKEEPKAEGKKE